MRFGSLFAGIGGIDLGLERAGLKCAWQVEVDSFCKRVLDKHWPHVPKHEDIREVTADELEPVDLICGGFPCQDLSVAGRRAGLAGERSGLFFELMRIVADLAPTWVLIENVPGLLSSNEGRDMGAVLGTLAKLGYGYAYRVLDSQYFGVAQRRRRVYIVGCLGDVRGAAKVLFESKSVQWDPPASKSTGADIARCLTRGTRIDSEAEDFVTDGRAVRRLTPVERERLQGFPDGWTDVDEGETPDSPRYRTTGNAVTVNVAEWIGRRLMRVAVEGALINAI